MGTRTTPVLAITQGDPASIGPELCVRAARRWLEDRNGYTPLFVAEPRSLAAVETATPRSGSGPLQVPWRWIEKKAALELELEAARARGQVPVMNPVLADAAERRPPRFAAPGPDDALGALAAIETATELALEHRVAGVVTNAVHKGVIAEHVDANFRGHTDTLASLCTRASQRELRYGRDYLMAFLGSDLRVALLSTHVPLRQALDDLTEDAVVDALICMRASLSDDARIAVAGLNPHAGEGGLLGSEDARIVAPAVARARQMGIDVRGPESADTLFLRARRGEFDWVLALYHDQGLIAVKTLAFGSTVNWTMGLPILRTSVDHGTAYDLGGWGHADPTGLFAAIDAAVQLSHAGASPQAASPEPRSGVRPGPVR